MTRPDPVFGVLVSFVAPGVVHIAAARRSGVPLLAGAIVLPLLGALGAVSLQCACPVWAAIAAFAALSLASAISAVRCSVPFRRAALVMALLPLGSFLLVKALVVDSVRVVSNSMAPTLLSGDLLLFDRLAFAFSAPSPGELVLLRHEDRFLVKRVVGVAHDQIGIFRGQLVRNGSVVASEFDPRANDGVAHSGWRERLGQTVYHVRYSRSASNGGEWHVPPDHFFVLGDDRDRSIDSRTIGPIPASALVGRPFSVWTSRDAKRGMRWARVGMLLERRSERRRRLRRRRARWRS